ncbi:MAG: hypothetical protein K8I00_03445 [Candidatus Omnitrophica bacterium]|nr:hypothetical protein [Candidatus Omnitrophota bacterium]
MTNLKFFPATAIRFCTVTLVAGLIIYGYAQGIVYFHEWRAVNNLRKIERAMQAYKDKHGHYVKLGEIWRTTGDVNNRLNLNIRDDIFNYQCFGWQGWTPWRCNAKSPLYDWWLHIHEKVDAHCASTGGHTCPGCLYTHDPNACY